MRIDLNAGTADMLVPDDELAHRRAEPDALPADAGLPCVPESQTPSQEIQRSVIA